MAESYPHIFTMIPDEEFFNRESEIEKLYNYALNIPKQLTSSIILTGRRGTGKTELLKRIYNRLFWKQNEVVPFYYLINRDCLSVQEFSKDYLSEFIKQYIGFIRKDHTLVNVKNLPFNKLLRFVYQTDNKSLIDLVENFIEASKDNDYLNLIRNSISAPLFIALNENTYIFPILDEFQYISNIHLNSRPHSISGQFQILLQSQITPHLIAASSFRSIENIFNDTFFLSGLDKMNLSAFRKEHAVTMFNELSKRFRVKSSPEISLDIVNQLEYNPFYIRSILKSAQTRKRPLLNLRDSQEIYAKEVIQGNINYYWISVLTSSIRDTNKRRNALEILNTLSRSPELSFSVSLLSRRLFLKEDEIQEILNSLDRAGFIDCKFDNARIVQDNILRDSIKSIYSIEIKNEPEGKVKNQLIGNKLKFISSIRKSHFKNELIKSLEILLSKFDCQKIPLSLFDYNLFYSIYEHQIKTTITEMLEREKERISLPQIIGTFRETLNDAYQVPTAHIVAYGFERAIYVPGNEVLWIVELLENTATITIKDIITFEKNVHTLAQRFNIKKILKWIVGKEIFDKTAIDLAKQYKIFCSNLYQLNKLIEIFVGVGEYAYTLDKEAKSPVPSNKKSKQPDYARTFESPEESDRDIPYSPNIQTPSISTEKESLSKIAPEDSNEFDILHNDTHSLSTAQTNNREQKYEIVVPLGPEVELITAKIAEAIAKNNSFDEESIGHIRMALIEAVINAKEYSDPKDERILLQFITDDTSMTVSVRNHGRKISPDNLKSTLNITDKIYTENKRGWGIKLMRNLMDEVEFEEVSNGTRLKMVKYKKHKKDNKTNQR